MATEDSGDYTEVDEGTYLTIVSASCVELDARRDVYGYLYKDFTADYFGDFEIHGKIHYDSAYTSSAGAMGYWNLFSDNIGDAKDIKDAAGKFVSLRAYYNGGMMFDLQNYDGSSETQDSMINFLAVTPRYYKFSRTGTTGQCLIYSDEAMTTLVDTLTLTLESDTFRYHYWVSSNDSNSGSAFEITNLTPENLEFQTSEAADKNFPNWFSGKGLYLAAPPE